MHSVPEVVDGSAASRPVGQPEVAVRKASMLTMAGGEDRRGMATGGRRTGVNRSPSVASSTASVFRLVQQVKRSYVILNFIRLSISCQCLSENEVAGLTLLGTH